MRASSLKENKKNVLFIVLVIPLLLVYLEDDVGGKGDPVVKGKFPVLIWLISNGTIACAGNMSSYILASCVN